MDAQSLHPIGCGCTDCCTGRSIPIELASRLDLYRAAKGQISNKSGESFMVTIRGVEIMSLEEFKRP